MQTIRHIWRSPTYPNRGEWITINLDKLAIWEEEAADGDADRQAHPDYWAMLSDQEWWNQLPSTSQYVPMDLALNEPYLSIAHEVCSFVMVYPASY